MYVCHVQVTLTDAPKIIPWEGPEWVVAVGCLTLKGGRTDWLVEKCTELGARAVIPLITQRSQTANKNKFKTSVGSKSSGVPDDYNAGRLERLAVAATKQSLRVHGLQLHPPTALNDVLPALSSASVSLLATAGAPPVLHQLQQRAASRKSWYVMSSSSHSVSLGCIYATCLPKACTILVCGESLGWTKLFAADCMTSAQQCCTILGHTPCMVRNNQ